jgi:hypothetical protein
MLRLMISRILLVAACATALQAQQTKVIPQGMDFVEGPSVSTVPFSQTTSGIQLLINANQITTSVGFLNGIKFRPSQVTATQNSPSFTKNYQIRCFTVPTTAAQLEALASPYDPNAVIAGATPTLVFNGPVTFPAVSQFAVAPSPFTIDFPFTQPYIFDGTQGNLLIMLESTDLQTTPGTYRIDAVQFREDQITGIAAPIDLTGCAVNGATLTSTPTAAQIVDNGAINIALASAPATAFPAAITMLSLTRADIDLGILGLPGCMSRMGSFDFSQFAIATGGVFAPVSWSIPNDPFLRGLSLVTQSLGLAASGNFADSAVSNAHALRIGESSLPPTINAMYGFHTVTSTVDSWFHGVVGGFTPVVQLDGLFP